LENEEEKERRMNEEMKSRFEGKDFYWLKGLPFASKFLFFFNYNTSY